MAKRISKDAQALLNLVSNERYFLVETRGALDPITNEVSDIEDAMLAQMGLKYDEYSKKYRTLDADGKWMKGLCAN